MTLFDPNTQTGFFPDAKTERGLKHIRELITIKQQGHRAVFLFLIQHTGITHFSPAFHIDPKYSQALIEADKQGVEILCYRTQINQHQITIDTKIPFSLT